MLAFKQRLRVRAFRNGKHSHDRARRRPPLGDHPFAEPSGAALFNRLQQIEAEDNLTWLGTHP